MPKWKSWGVAERSATIQAVTAVVIAILTIVLTGITIRATGRESQQIAIERIGTAVLLDASRPAYDRGAREIIVDFTNVGIRPISSDYVEMYPLDDPGLYNDVTLGVVGPSRTVQLRFSVPETFVTGGDLRPGTYQFAVRHVGLLGERVQQIWHWQYHPDAEHWRMTTLRVDPNVEGYGEQEIPLD
jgi:hypothetical protein